MSNVGRRHSSFDKMTYIKEIIKPLDEGILLELK